MRLIPSNIRSTRLKPLKKRSKNHQVGVFLVDDDNMKNLIAMDFAGRYPVTSKRGHKYIFIMYDYDSNYTFAVPVKTRKTSEYLRAFQECYDELKNRGFTAQLLRLNNKISKDLIACIGDNELDFQIVSECSILVLRTYSGHLKGPPKSEEFSAHRIIITAVDHNLKT